MSEAVTIQNTEESNVADARGRPYVSLNKLSQLAQARESKKRKAEEAELRQREVVERLAHVEGLLSTIATPSPAPRQTQTNVAQEHSDEEDEPHFPPPTTQRKRRRLLNEHRRERFDDYVEPAGWSTWAKVGTVAGLVIFNAVIGKALRHVRGLQSLGSTADNTGDNNIGFE